MTEKRIETSKAPELIVHCQGDLQVGGWAEPAVLIKGDAFSTNMDSDGNAGAPVEKALSIEGSGDLLLMIPATASLVVNEVNGNLQVRNLEGDLNLTTIMGDVALRNVGSVTADNVRGDLAARNLNGAFSAREIMGDASLRSVESMHLATVFGDCAISFASGDVHLETVMGDLSLKTINGNVSVGTGHRDINLRNLGSLVSIESVHGDIRLRGGLAPGKHTLNAEGDIVVRWPVEAPLTVTATAPEILNRLPLVDVTEEVGSLAGRIGDGETFLFLKTNGRIILKEGDSGNESWDDVEGQAFDFDFAIDLGGLGDHIAAEINSRMADVSARLENQFGPEFAARMEEKARAAATKAEKAAERALKQAEKAAKKARWQSGQGGQWAPPPPPPSPGMKAKQASVEEQLKILRMVENGIISPDEANDLLEAIAP